MYFEQIFVQLFIFFSLPTFILTHTKLKRSHCNDEASGSRGSIAGLFAEVTGGVKGVDGDDMVIKNISIVSNSDDEDDDGSDKEKLSEYTYLKTFNWTVHCKFQKNERFCTNQKMERKYFFDLHTGQCERFRYGHCKDIFNIFSTRQGCRDQCQDDAYAELNQQNLKPSVFCRFQPVFGDCTSYFPSFYFDVTQQRCRGFSYSGCGGNRNRFSGARECLHVCGVDTVLSLDKYL